MLKKAERISISSLPPCLYNQALLARTTLSRTNFHGPIGNRAIEVRLYGSITLVTIFGVFPVPVFMTVSSIHSVIYFYSFKYYLHIYKEQEFLIVNTTSFVFLTTMFALSGKTNRWLILM